LPLLVIKCVRLPLTHLLMLDVLKINGAKRIRTADPLNAIEVRYQLRYNPLQSIMYNCSIIGTLSSFLSKVNFKYLP
jgi:hypothetical protein